MQYNLHPIFVHFPIAFLFLYSLIKLIPLSRWIPSVAWRDIERVLLVCGAVGLFFATSTGEMADSLIKVDHSVKEAHEVSANITGWMYGLLLAGEVIAFLNKGLIQKIRIVEISKLLTFLEKVFLNKFISNTLVILGFLALFITGLLGGAMVYGESADPLVPIVFKILGIS